MSQELLFWELFTEGSLMTLSLIGLVIALQKYVNNPIQIAQQKENKIKQSKMRWEYLSNYVSLLHAVMATLIASYILCTSNESLDSQNSNAIKRIISFSLSYFLVDTVFGLLHGYNDFLMNIHHFLAIYINLYILRAGKYGHCYMYIMVIGEFNNPLWIMRKNLEKHNARKIYSTLLGLTYGLSFLIVRGLLAPHYMAKIISLPMALAFKLDFAFLWYLSLFWCYTIVNYLVKGFKVEYGWSFLDKIYDVLLKMRTKPQFQIPFHLAMIVFAFKDIFISWNHESLY